ncbi:PucR family transcriptional regulator [Priestia flexa]|nr:helix-turn-helix domain-containing protein [Priestia flexa]MCM3066772.1 helix-turn-helix domain-containing protein [Priestia flexa]
MMEQLKSIFGNKLLYSDVPYHFHQYKWFRSDEYHFIGIEQDALSEKELALLSAFLIPYEAMTTTLSAEQSYWYQLLFEDKPAVIDELDKFKLIRFTYFSIKRLFEQRTEFEDALSSMYATPITILWDNLQSGVIIEKVADSSELTRDLQDSVTILSHDFESDMQFFEGQLHSFPFSPSRAFHMEKSWFEQVQKVFEKEKVIKLSTTLPYWLIKEMSPAAKEQMNTILSLIKDDETLLNTVKCYLECNLNVSLAAKKLYMHRNSLQYRIDKFIDRTDLDIKNFQGAVSAYLAILAAESLNQ